MQRKARTARSHLNRCIFIFVDAGGKYNTRTPGGIASQSPFTMCSYGSPMHPRSAMLKQKVIKQYGHNAFGKPARMRHARAPLTDRRTTDSMVAPCSALRTGATPSAFIAFSTPETSGPRSPLSVSISMMLPLVRARSVVMFSFVSAAVVPRRRNACTIFVALS